MSDGDQGGTGNDDNPFDDPFDELETGLDPDREIDDAAFEEIDDAAFEAFEEVEHDEIDGDVWAQLQGEKPVDSLDLAGAGEDERQTPEEPIETVVEKRRYCQRCPHLSDPPDVACDHEGTSIVEVVDVDRFRVRNCPMVDAGGPAFDPDS